MSITKRMPLLVMGALLLVVVILAGCQGTETVTVAPTCPETTPCPAPEGAAAQAPFMDLWAASGHAMKDAVAFTHWNEEDPAEIPPSCAKCHSSAGFVEFAGTGAIAANVPVGSVIECTTCHNDATANLTSVTFPSGAVISGLGKEAVCMTCHQGMASMVQVDEAIAAVAAADEDTAVAELGFTNPHYFAAAITRYGTLTKGGYEYTGKTYDALWEHTAGYETCTDCHDSHSLEVKVDECATCHTGVAVVEDIRNIRMMSSGVDYDGDGDIAEGIAGELDGVRATLYTAIQAYSKETAGAPAVYSAAAYPYFFVDTNADGVTDEAEAVFPNAYKSWTPRMLKAAYNYQMSIKDPGAYAHGGKYIIELLYDSIEDLNTKLATPVDMSAMHREDPGHFAGSSMAFRDWDDTGVVPAACSKCHSATGLPQFIKEGVNISNPSANGFTCETCHSDLATYALYDVPTVTFPSGAKVGFETKPSDNLCLSCHQGRESTVSVNKAVGTGDADTVVDKLGFKNVHYFAAGATLFGADVKGMYEYEGKTYDGKFAHVANVDTCSACHDVHTLTVNTTACQGCHSVEDPGMIRMKLVADYDGDGDVTEGVKGEIEGLQAILYTSLQTYAKDKLGTPILYSAAAYPYFFIDTNANGTLDADEGTAANKYAAWTPRLLKAAYNLQYSIKDPGAYAHNGAYVIQALYDSIEDLGGDVTTLVRP